MIEVMFWVLAIVLTICVGCLVGMVSSLIFGFDESETAITCLLLTISAGITLLVSGVVPRSIKDVEATQQRRATMHRNFIVSCQAKNGKIVDVSGKHSRLDRVCISTDGRWLAWY